MGQVNGEWLRKCIVVCVEKEREAMLNVGGRMLGCRLNKRDKCRAHKI